MNTQDVVSKISSEHNISHGRAEMILHIVMERIKEKIYTDRRVDIQDFGEFNIIKKEIDPIYNQKNPEVKQHVVFKPYQKFLDIINS